MMKDLKVNIDKFIIIGDKVLIKPRTEQPQTNSGLFLPPNVQQKEMVHSGYIVKAGPGYPIPNMVDEDEPWKEKGDDVKYIPLQATTGDLAIYLQKSGFEIEFNDEKFIIVPHNAILMVIRDDE